MEQPLTVEQQQEEGINLEQWRYQEAIEIQHKKQKLAASQHNLDIQKQTLEREKKEFARRKEMEESRIRQENHLFDMKWKILEGELQKLATEKQQVERQKAFYSKVQEYQRRETRIGTSSNVVKGELFFLGVGNEAALKKRYKDLIKIFHPDNLAGDTGTIQEINREYDKLKKELTI